MTITISISVIITIILALAFTIWQFLSWTKEGDRYGLGFMFATLTSLIGILFITLGLMSGAYLQWWSL